LEARGFSPQECAQVTCPIGLPGIHGKAPEVVAVAVAAQLLQWVERDRALEAGR
jgi:xanthine dehydrogenase accessory factor